MSAVIEALPSVIDSKAIRNLLWVLGEFCREEVSCLSALDSIVACLGELPMLAAEERYEAALQKELKDDDGTLGGTADNKPSGATSSARPKVLADGTYATESSFDSTTTTGASAQEGHGHRQLPNIKKLFLDGKFECSGVLANALVKLLIRLRSSSSSTLNRKSYEEIRARCLLVFTSILRLGSSRFVASPLDSDSAERIALCIQLALQEDKDAAAAAALEQAFIADSEAAFNSILSRESCCVSAVSTAAKAAAIRRVHIDDPVDFGFAADSDALAVKKAAPTAAVVDDLDALISGTTATTTTTMTAPIRKSTSPSSSSSTSSASGALLNKIVQLTGFSDTIYAETYVQVRDKEIYLDILLVNQTEETLQNLSVDLNCAGDLKLIEHPTQMTLSPLAFSTCKAVLKVTATNHGQIFGSISFLAGNEPDSVILAEHRIDVLEYISPASIPESRFRETWVLLEWENKITIRARSSSKTSSDAPPLLDFINFLSEAGRMTCITPDAGLQGNSTFLACNFYAKSVFDEEILANICLEYAAAEGMISGHLRLRSKTQGLAIAFGDKLNSLIQSKKD